ncbi:MAG: CAP domain-containing protein [Nanoarchaeota archaeon]
MNRNLDSGNILRVVVIMFLFVSLFFIVKNLDSFTGFLVTSQTGSDVSANGIVDSNPISIPPKNNVQMAKSVSTASIGGTDWVVHPEVINHLNAVNNYRAQNGLPALVPSVKLTQSAEWMANDMGSHDYFGHVDSLGRNIDTRFPAFGYTFNTWISENVAAGRETGVTTADDLYYHCDEYSGGVCIRYGHRNNMLNPNIIAIGIGYAYYPNADYDWYWTEDLGGVLDEQANYISSGQGPLSCSGPIDRQSNRCRTECGASPHCNGLVAGDDIGYCGAGGDPAIHDECSSDCQPVDRPDMLCRKVGVSDCSGSQECDGERAGTGNCDLNCIYVSSFTGHSMGKGDVNCNDKIDSVDALYILKDVAQLIQRSSTCQIGKAYQPAMDTEPNGVINAVDALNILKAVSGLASPVNNMVGNPGALDSDSDGISDAWELQYSCLNRFVADATSDSDSDSVQATFGPVRMDNAAEIIIRSDPCNTDSDGDGFSDGAEFYLGTDPLDNCGPNAWPADIVSGGIPASTNRVTVLDLTSFLAPNRFINTNIGDIPGNRRWDIAPGKGPFSKDINVQDITLLISLAPPMFGGQRAFNGPTCTP